MTLARQRPENGHSLVVQVPLVDQRPVFGVSSVATAVFLGSITTAIFALAWVVFLASLPVLKIRRLHLKMARCPCQKGSAVRKYPSVQRVLPVRDPGLFSPQGHILRQLHSH